MDSTPQWNYIVSDWGYISLNAPLRLVQKQINANAKRPPLEGWNVTLSANHGPVRRVGTR